MIQVKALLSGKLLAGFATALMLTAGLAVSAHAQTVLIDFGNNVTSYRGLPIANPDANGYNWNSLQPGLFYTDLVDSDNNATTIDFGFSTPVGTDSYNGPAGATSAGTILSDVTFADVDATSLGILGGACDADTGTGTCEGVFDFAATDPGAPVRFEIQELDLTKTYNLTFFGSHKYSVGNTTTYNVYTDDTYTTLVDSASLQHQDSSDPSMHNRDMVATISGVSPSATSILYLEFIGDSSVTGSQGYLNVMQLEGMASSLAGDFDEDGDVDGNDFLVWQRDLNVGSLTDWQDNYGAPALVAALGAVPEPNTFCLLLLTSLGAISFRRTPESRI